MKKPKQIAKNVYIVGAIDKEKKLFHEFAPLPDGTSYNSYLIMGSEKAALIDTVPPEKLSVLLKNLKSAKVKNIDYIIANHAEQDHSGSIPFMLKKYPNAKVICSKSCKQMLIDLLEISENNITVMEDREKLSLGDKTLEFIYTPWVHWPETMSTYLREDKIIFACDLFGSHLAKNDSSGDNKQIMDATKKYFAEVMMPLKVHVKRNLEIIKDYEINFIAPSHGPVHKNPKAIFSAYEEWLSQNVKNEVVIAYVSIHKSTETMVNYLSKQLNVKGINVKRINLSDIHYGDLSIHLVDPATVILASPMFLASAHPTVITATYLINMLKPKLRFLGTIGSFGWGGNMAGDINNITLQLKAERLSPVIIKGAPKEKDFKMLDSLAEEICNKHKIIGVLK